MIKKFVGSLLVCLPIAGILFWVAMERGWQVTLLALGVAVATATALFVGAGFLIERGE